MRPSALHTARPGARAGVVPFAVLSSLVVAALALPGSVAFAVGSGDAVRLGAAAALLFALGVAACSLANRSERRRRRAELRETG